MLHPKIHGELAGSHLAMFPDRQYRIDDMNDAVPAIDVGLYYARVVDMKPAPGVDQQIVFQHRSQRSYLSQLARGDSARRDVMTDVGGELIEIVQHLLYGIARHFGKSLVVRRKDSD